MEKDLNYKSDVIEFTPKQILAGKIISAVVTSLLIIWLTLVAFSVVQLSFWRVLTGSILGAIGITLLLSGVVQKNSVSIWFAFPFLIPALIEFLCISGVSEYQYLYPLYIAIPAISSLACIPFFAGKKAHLKVISFFLLQAIFYLLSVLGIIQIFVSVILCITLTLVAIVYILIRIFKGGNLDE